MKRLGTALAISAMALCLATPTQAQALKESEVKSEVPALTAMHAVINPMWHDAWPKKDTAALAGLTGQIEKHLSAIQKAELPGILRDKFNAWKEGVDKLAETVAMYKAAAKAKDDEGLLKAAETLHANYESLVKIVRPILKEMDAYHAQLYVLYHYQLEPLDLPKATATIRGMKPAIDALNAAVLPDRLKARQDAFVTQRARLSKAYDELMALINQGNTDRLKQGIEQMHAEYEKLEQVF